MPPRPRGRVPARSLCALGSNRKEGMLLAPRVASESKIAVEREPFLDRYLASGQHLCMYRATLDF